jgi:hypothetical protein
VFTVAGFEAVGEQSGLPRTDLVAVQGGEGRIAEGGRMRFSIRLRTVSADSGATVDTR